MHRLLALLAALGLVAQTPVAEGTKPNGIVDGGDALYGTTLGSGGGQCGFGLDGCGLLYRLNYDGSDFRIIHRFGGGDGSFPRYPPALGPDGRLYGAAAGFGNGEYNDGSGTYDDRSVIYSIRRDGSDFRVLFRYPKDSGFDPGVSDRQPVVVVAPDGSVYAGVPNSSGAARNSAIAKIVEGKASVLHDFGERTEILQLAADGQRLYVLTGQADGLSPFTELHELLSNGGVRTIAAKTYIGSIAISAGRLFATIPSKGEVVRVSENGIDTVYRASPVWISRYRPAVAEIGAYLSGAPDGGVVGESDRLGDLNCGTLFQIRQNGSVATLGTLPPSQAGPCITTFGESAPIVAGNGTIYAAVFDEARCNPGTTACGDVVAVTKSGTRVVHSFAPAPTPSPAVPTSYFVEPTGVPREFSVSVRFVDRMRIAATPSPLPVLIGPLSGRASISLRYTGRALAPVSPYLHEPSSGPVLIYRSPRLEPGFYHASVSLLGQTTAFYEPPEPFAPPSLRPGQRFLAIDLSLSPFPQAATTPSGDSFGANVISIASSSGSALQMRAAGESFAIPRPRNVLSIRGMLPLVEDAAQREAERTYAGRIVYPTKDCVVMTADRSNLPTPDRIRVKAVYRVYGAAPHVNPGAGPSNEALVTAVNPLIVAFDDGSFALALDPWEIERIVSLHPLFDPSWPARYRTSIGRALPGMTYDMVVAQLGYPSDFETVENERRMSHWHYDRPANSSIDVYFKGGRAVKVDEGSGPPG